MPGEIAKYMVAQQVEIFEIPVETDELPKKTSEVR